MITYEFENIDIGSVRRLESLGYRVTPGSGVLHVTQNRLLGSSSLASRDSRRRSRTRLQRGGSTAAAERIGFPAVLKTVRGGYDGKGQWMVDSLAKAR